MRVRLKPSVRGFSETVMPLLDFTQALVRTLDELPVTAFSRDNHVALQLSLQQQLPAIVAVEELTDFFAAWNIRVVSFNRSPPPGMQINYDADTRIAILKSLRMSEIGARAQRTNSLCEQGAVGAKKIGEAWRKDFLAEVDLVNMAIQHRLARWAENVPSS